MAPQEKERSRNDGFREKPEIEIETETKNKNRHEILKETKKEKKNETEKEYQNEYENKKENEKEGSVSDDVSRIDVFQNEVVSPYFCTQGHASPQQELSRKLPRIHLALEEIVNSKGILSYYLHRHIFSLSLRLCPPLPSQTSLFRTYVFLS